MPQYIIFAILAAIGFSLSNLIFKFTSKHNIANPWVLQFYSGLTLLPFLLILPVFFSVSFPRSGWQYIFLYALTFFLGNIFFLKAIYKLDMSTIAPLFQLQSALVGLLAFIFLGERFPIENYFLIIVMLIGATLVSIDEKMNWKSIFSLGVMLILLQQFFHALSNLFAGFALKSMNSFTFLFWGDSLAELFTLGFVWFLIGSRRLKIPWSQIKPLFIAGLFSTIGASSLFTAFQSNLTISSALALLTAPIVFGLTLTASIFKPELLEHHTAKIYILRGLGVLLIFLAAVKIAVG